MILLNLVLMTIELELKGMDVASQMGSWSERLTYVHKLLSPPFGTFLRMGGNDAIRRDTRLEVDMFEFICMLFHSQLRELAY